MTDRTEQTSRSALKRLSQVAAVTSGSRLEDTIDWLLPMLAYYSEGPWRESDDWHEEIKAAYGIEITLHDIGASLSRLQAGGQLIWQASKGQYSLSRSAITEVESKIEEASQLEGRVKELWLGSMANHESSLSSREQWEILMDYCAPVFRIHGVDAVQLISENAPTTSDETHEQLLKRVFDNHEVPTSERINLRHAISIFFQSKDPDILTYVAQLADSNFNLLALCVDEDSRNFLRAGMPELKIFVDTNILFSLLGTHDTPLAAASIDLFRVISQAKLPFKLYYHAKTLNELTQSIENASYRLRKQSWAKHVSTAIVQLPWQVTRVSGIEMRFHQLNAVQTIDPAAFCARYENPAALLAEHGLQIFREPDVAQGQERLELRSTLISDYKEYLAKNPRRKNSNYAKLDHDCSLWMTAKDHQKPTTKGIVFSGSFFLSSDYVLWRFDRDVLRLEYNARPVVVLPDALLQALRPFVGGAQFDNRAFVQAFGASEFRAGGGADLSGTVRRVASYLAVFEDLPEETAVRILSDNILMEGLRRYEDSAPEFAEAIGKAIFAHNEALVRERDELLEERGMQLDLAKQALRGISTDTSTDVYESLSSLVRSLESQSKSGPVIHNYGGVVNTDSGGVYHNDRTQVGAQGPGASATDNAFTMQLAELNADPALVHELLRVKEQLLASARDADDYDAVAGVQGAIEALEAKEESKALGALRRAGQKALDVAVDIGASVAQAAIKMQLGI